MRVRLPQWAPTMLSASVARSRISRGGATVTATAHMLMFAISRDRLNQVMQSNQAARDRMKKVLAPRYGS